MSKRYLILADGSTYEGIGFGSEATTFGHIVFNTAMTGYQEIITNQIYHNQIIVFSAPTIGAGGINHDAYESIFPTAKGVIVRDVAEVSTNRLKRMNLDEFLTRHNIPGITGIDTRALIRHLRETGPQKASIVDFPDDHAFDQLNATVLTTRQVDAVATPRAYPNPGTGSTVVVIDFGLKHGILRQLSLRDADVTVLPYTVDTETVLSLDPDAVIFSTGPGDPRDLPNSVFELMRQLQERVPLLGIGLGHEIFGLANGASLVKLPFEHHGTNHPVKEVITNALLYVPQGAGYAVDPTSIDHAKLITTHIDIIDNSVQGLRHRDYPAFSVAFFPDSAPGPLEGTTVIDELFEMIETKDRF
ncbi:carbamoyl phosphate synthase small subunit [Periweissella beninensis]|uniref:carbamoyl phosphate synthase small subunit n=1 Tax=Periweissella beninensis TaxID=504936 RepID=UPI0021A49C56|nr:carbamoyl phosphate synthase small subunit [Periweissella beninensis]MCT4395773.1 carbamoyl phosphate synthase small subunit [Periweissella beninensis]